MRSRVLALVVAAATATALLTGCSNDDDGKTVTLVTHSSFSISKETIKKFEKESGYKLRVLRDGDAGEALNKAILTKDNPQGDAFFGVDNTYLSRALDSGIFAEYQPKDADMLDEELRLDTSKRATPIDSGEVCVNFDKKSYEGKTAPNSLDDLIKPEFKDQLVVENPATSSPGLAFLLATVAKYGNDGYQDYWRQLKANGVEIVDGWDQAYFEKFAGPGSNGDNPMVVSYASSPVAEVVGTDPAPESAPTGVATQTCFRQVEFAGVLKGAKNSAGAKKLIDFMIGQDFQADIPLNMYVNPARSDVDVPEVYAKNAVAISDPFTIEPARITDNREDWIKNWKTAVGL